MHPNTEQNSLKDFFISYSDADQQWAEWIAWQLEAEKYKVFFKSWDVRPGNNAVLATHKATTQAKRTIAVLSPDYLSAFHTAAEWAAAFQKDSRAEKGILLPVHVCECRDELGGLLSQIAHIDLVGLDESAACDKLLKAVSGVRGKPETKPLFP